MYHTSTAIPQPSDISASCHDSGTQGRLRVIRIGGCSIHVDNRDVMDSLQRALNAIRDDFNAAEIASVAVAS